MLVLTRKIDEQIRIGENITITLIRVQGGTVRIGIDAPRDVRVLRGELAESDSAGSSVTPGDDADSDDPPYSEREEAFAHPQVIAASAKNNRDNSSLPQATVLRTGKLHFQPQNLAVEKSAVVNRIDVNRVNNIPKPKAFFTRISSSDLSHRSDAGPLANFTRRELARRELARRELA